jgi:paraquat-inducible protein B
MRRASPATVGAFVVGAVLLVVAGLLVFGSGTLFRKSSTYVLYFDDAVTGLYPGAPVVLGGVKVGEVTEISVTIDEALDIDVPVLIELGGGNIQPRSGEAEALPAQEQAIPVLIKRGLRAQLATQSFLTGQLLISLVFAPDKEAVFRGDGRIPEIPTITSPLAEVQERLKDLPLREIANEVMGAVRSIEGFFGSPELADAVANLNGMLVSLRGLSDEVTTRVAPLAGTTDETLASLRRLADELSAQLGPLAESADEALGTLAEDSPTRYALDEALGELAAAARSIRILADYLERHPEALLSGKGAGGR